MVALEELCAEAGVQLLYHTFISDVLVENGTVKAIVAVNKSGTVVIAGDIFIDCTGDGDVSVLAGAQYTKGNPETGKNQRFRCATSSAAWTFRRWANSSRAKSNAPASPATAPIRRRFRSTPPAAVTAQLCPTFSSAPSLPGDLTVEGITSTGRCSTPRPQRQHRVQQPRVFRGSGRHQPRHADQNTGRRQKSHLPPARVL